MYQQNWLCECFFLSCDEFPIHIPVCVCEWSFCFCLFHLSRATHITSHTCSLVVVEEIVLSQLTFRPYSVFCIIFSACNIHQRINKLTHFNACNRGVFMLQMSTLLMRETCRLPIKNLRFWANSSWIEKKSVCID